MSQPTQPPTTPGPQGGIVDQRAEQGGFVDQPAKLLRIAGMIREMLAEVRRAPLDDEGRKRLGIAHDRSVAELKEVLSPELREELDDVAFEFGEDVPTESELRVAQAQLVGWLEGLFHGIQAALWAQHQAAQAQMDHFPRKALDPSKEGAGHYL